MTMYRLLISEGKQIPNSYGEGDLRSLAKSLATVLERALDTAELQARMIEEMRRIVHDPVSDYYGEIRTKFDAILADGGWHALSGSPAERPSKSLSEIAEMEALDLAWRVHCIEHGYITRPFSPDTGADFGAGFIAGFRYDHWAEGGTE